MRKLIWLAVGVAAACLAGALCYGGWTLPTGIGLLLFAGALIFVARKHKKFMLPLLIVIGCGAGLVWFYTYDALFVTVPRTADGVIRPAEIEASDYSIQSGYGCTVEGTVKLADGSYRVKAYLNEKETIAPGDRISGIFRFRLTTDGGMEDPTNHRSEGIFLLAYSSGKMQITKAEELPLKYYPAVWRQQILERIRTLLPGDAGGFASALLLGDRSGITYEMNTAFKVSGISHIIAVSGLHVSILFGLIYTLLARRRILSCVIGIPALFLFAAIAGFTPSITRACIMQSLMLLAMLLDREYDGPSALSFAVLAMLAVNPLTILSVSFQLSVGCIVGIFLFSERIQQWLLQFSQRGILKTSKFLSRWYKGMASSVSVSVSATVMTTPLVAYHFGCVSVFGVLTNLLTLWIISFIFYMLIGCLLLSLLHMGLARLIAGIVQIPIWYVLSVAKGISRLPMAGVYTSNPYVVVWLFGAYGTLILFLFLRKKQPMQLTACLTLTLLLTQLFSWTEPLRDDFRVTMLDVGQGQSILLQSDGKTFLVDCGGDYGSEAADVAAEELLNQGISRLDGIIVTHYDADHAGGVENLLSRIHTDRLILPYFPEDDGASQTLASATDGAVEYISQDLNYTFGSTEMTIFAPFSQESDNENSICILFRREECGILITGDRGTEGERMLLQAYALPEVDVLVAGHHGSAGSTSQELLDAVSPEIAFISVGEGNRYGHPTDAVLQRLKASGCKIYRTDLHGTIIFRR